MPNTPLEIKIIVGSTREGRFSEKPARWIFEMLSKIEDVHAEILDLREFHMPFFEEAVAPYMKDTPYAHSAVASWTAKINEGEAFIIVTPEYNHGYPAVLKNALDYVYQEWNKKPVAFISYGGASGVRAVEQLRLVVIELQMAPMRAAVHIPFENYLRAINDPTTPTQLLFKNMDKKADAMLAELLWWGSALKKARSDDVSEPTLSSIH